jgi:GNAT superfamily N-acetyltransferase
MGVEYLENVLTAETLAGLRDQAGWQHTEVEQAQKALQNTCFSIAALDGGKTVGMGRLIGDGAMIWYIQDVIVAPEYRHSGVGTAIVQKLLEYVRREAMPGTNVAVGLMSAKGKEPFYERFGFYVRPNDREGAGMMIRLKV